MDDTAVHVVLRKLRVVPPGLTQQRQLRSREARSLRPAGLRHCVSAGAVILSSFEVNTILNVLLQ